MSSSEVVVSRYDLRSIVLKPRMIRCNVVKSRFSKLSVSDRDKPAEFSRNSNSGLPGICKR